MAVSRELISVCFNRADAVLSCDLWYIFPNETLNSAVIVEIMTSATNISIREKPFW